MKPIVGYGRIVKSLKNAISARQISHAYIFSGASGAGKSLLANRFAKALECEAGGTEPCGVCSSCRVFESANHPDIFYVSATGKSLGVDDVRDRIITPMHTGPYRFRYKIFIIDGAHTMTPQAQNALLKTIEEPAAYGIFILLAESLGGFLPTVLSRCVAYKLGALSYAEVYAYLANTGAAEDAARMAAVYAQGNIGRGLQLLQDTEFMEMRTKISDLMDRLSRADLTRVFVIAKEFEAFKERIFEALDIIYLHYRDALVLRAADKRFLIQSEAVPQVGDEVFTGLSAVWDAKRRLRHYANFQLTIEVMLLDIWRARHLNEEPQREGKL